VIATLYRNGNVYTPADPFASAALVVDDTVAWVGSEEAAEAHADAAQQVVDLDGGLMTPAFVDAHVHVSETGLALTGLDLSQSTSLAQVLDLVADAARRSAGRPVLGHGWDEHRWPEGRPLTRAELDQASYGGVVYLARTDVHSAVVSSALASAARLSDLPGWGADGLVRGDAHVAARQTARSGLTPAQVLDLQRIALRAAAAAGIGAVHEMSAPGIGSAQDLRGVVELAESEHLPEVVPYWGELVSDAAAARELLASLALPDHRPLRGLAGDLCMDGSIGSRSAALRQPYLDLRGGSDDPGDGAGTLYLTADAVCAHVVACTEIGVQAGFHVIGDAAAAEVLRGFDQAAQQVGAAAVRRGRHRLEHAEMLDDEAVAALVRNGLVASMQPAFQSRWGGPGGMYADRLGQDRAAGMNRWGSLSSAGVPLALGSDSPVTPFEPWEALRACVLHDQENERISVRAAFLAHTRGGRRAARQDDQGVLAPGAPATFALWEPSTLVVQAPDARVQAWSTDPRSGSQRLPDLRPGVAAPACLRTVVRGVTVYDASR
jgi:predicted amidohydrolase YtcJ